MRLPLESIGRVARLGPGLAVPVLAVLVGLAVSTQRPDLAVGAFAAVLATGTWFLTFTRELDDRAELSIAVRADRAGDQTALVLRLVNRGRRIVRVERLELVEERRVPASEIGSTWMEWPPSPRDLKFPLDLGESESREVFDWLVKVALRGMGRRDVPRYVFAEDSLGRAYWRDFPAELVNELRSMLDGAPRGFGLRGD